MLKQNSYCLDDVRYGSKCCLLPLLESLSTVTMLGNRQKRDDDDDEATSETLLLQS